MRERVLDTAHLEKIRRKKRMKKLRIAVAVCLLLVVILLWLTGIGSLYVTRISETLETLELQLRKGNGFPVALVMEPEVQGAAMTAASVLMDDREVCVYSETGSALRSFQHGYARPGLVVGKTRFCIFNQGGRELRIEGRSRSYGTLTTDNPILFAAMSPGGNFAAVTQSDSYQARVAVYNDAMDEMFSWYCAEEYPVTAVFSENGKQVAVGCLFSGGGMLHSKLYLVDAEGEHTSIERPNSVILAVQYRDKDRLLVVYDDAAVLYAVEDLRQLASYVLTDSLLCCDLQGEEAILLVQGDTSRGSGVTLTALSEELTPLRSVTVGETVEQCVMRGRTAFLIGNGRLLCYTLDVTASKEHPAGTDEIIALEHRPLCLINSRELLLLTARQLTAALPAAE
jgi:hypothetical protein